MLPPARSSSAPARHVLGPLEDRHPARWRGTRLELDDGLPFDTWLGVGRRLADVSSASAWWLGDWLVYGERTYGERYKRAIAATALDYQTLRNYAWVARRFDPSRRRDSLSLHHHAEVAALPEAEQDLWLARAQRARWSRNELRRQIRNARRLRNDPADTVVCRLEVTPTNEERWHAAADMCGRPLAEWIISAVDAAAEVALSAPPRPAALPVAPRGSRRVRSTRAPGRDRSSA